MYALNLTHSPENLEYWESADPFHAGAGHAASARTERDGNKKEVPLPLRAMLNPGTRVAHYEILEPIGKGNPPHHGMGWGNLAMVACLGGTRASG